ncbi:mannitol dehydrogenase family protein [Jatrophihabitans sp. YIM 134969]
MRIVHLGLGNFHRAHQAVYTRDAGDGWEITGVAHRSRDVVDALRAQGYRYHVVVIGGDRVEVEPVEVVTGGLVLADDRDAVVARIADPDTAVVTMTVTEKAYALGPDGFPGDLVLTLVEALRARAAHGTPVTVVSCDNLAGNGRVVESLVRGVAAGDTAFTDFLDAAVGFPSTMVDRIVPATTAETVELARSGGFDDAVPVPAEPFSQWVLQPRFTGPRPDWERAGAIVTDDVEAWETVKVRLLNGVHSLLAHLGLLRGDRLIAEAHRAPAVRAAADALGDEYLPTLRVPERLDVADYRAALSRRFDNAALGHRCAQVAADGSVKLTQRVPAAAAYHLDRGRVPHLLALVVAAWLHGLADPDALVASERPSDPAAAAVAAAARDHAAAADLARAVVVDQALLGATLAARPEFADRVGDLLDVLRRHGPDAAAGEAAAA